VLPQAAAVAQMKADTMAERMKVVGFIGFIGFIGFMGLGRTTTPRGSNRQTMLNPASTRGCTA
jgi:hypothetical protein